LLLACLSSLGFGMALVTSKLGLRFLDARSGAAISIPTATLLFIVASPFALTASGFTLHAALLFALVGLFFPAVVTLLTFQSNDRLGPVVTSSVSSTAPLFALAAAALLLGEDVPPKATLASIGVVVGVTLLLWKPARLSFSSMGWALLLPIVGAMVRGLAQVVAKAGLLLWPNPFAASLIGYLVSSATVIAVNRLPRANRPSNVKAAIAWFVLTGILNGGAVLLMYAALSTAPVSMVAPVVAIYPLVTVFLSAAVLREEAPGLRGFVGAAVTVAAIAYLVAA
jgi:drug/metabolite transporter (DMT)-like permease